MPKSGDIQPYKFSGFLNPTTTPVPDVVFDELLTLLTGSELKVLLYIIRRTFGFKKDRDSISLSQMLTGIQKRDGTVIDRGAGIKDKGTLLTTLRSLIDKNLITITRNCSLEKGNEPTTYALNFITPIIQSDLEEENGNFPPPLGGKSHQGVGRENHPSPRVENPTTQQTVLQQTDFNNSNFEIEKPRILKIQKIENTEEDGAITPEARTNPPIIKFKLKDTGPNASNQIPIPEADDETSPPNNKIVDFTSAGSILSGKYKFGDPKKATKEDTEVIGVYISDFSRELFDEAPRSSLTLAVRIFEESRLDRSKFISNLIEAKKTTQIKTPDIKKRRTNTAGSIAQKNKMPYFFSVLRDKCGLKGP